jgi:hypothetical protein
MAVKGEVSRIEEDEAVEDGQDPLLAAAHVAAPELEVPAPLLLPVLVQKHERVQAPIDLELGVNVEVGVDLQKPTGHDLVQATAPVVRIWNEAVNPGQRFQESQENGRVEVEEHPFRVPGERRGSRHSRIRLELPLGGIVVAFPSRFLDVRKLLEEVAEHVVGKEAVDDDMGEGCVRRELRAVSLGTSHQFIGIEKLCQHVFP